MSILVKTIIEGGPVWAVRDAAGRRRLGLNLDELLGLPLQDIRDRCAGATEEVPTDASERCPVDSQEIWAAGVTYRRSRDGRIQESGFSAAYDAVYEAPRPELFFKSTGPRAVGDGEPIGVRRDSDWNVPEPELGLVVNRFGELVGYVVGNDVSSRSIEGANPLYLPQAKVYERACAIGPGIVPAWEVDATDLGVRLTVSRAGSVAYQASISTAAMRRSPAELVDWLTRALDFPVGVLLLTGTGIVPELDFTLCADDVVSIEIEHIGTLTNPVIPVGRPAL